MPCTSATLALENAIPALVAPTIIASRPARFCASAAGQPDTARGGCGRPAPADRDNAVEIAGPEARDTGLDHLGRRVRDRVGKDRPRDPRAIEERCRPIEDAASGDIGVADDERP